MIRLLKSDPDFKWWEGGAGAMLDQIICSCGWKSKTYFDGREYAMMEWRQHVKTSQAVGMVHAVPPSQT